MTGPEHYREAELILQTTGEDDHWRAYKLRVAQVHATLAVAAASADPYGKEDRWEEVTR